MPVPVTRDLSKHTQTGHQPGTLARPASSGAGLALPPSNGTTLPRGQGTVHTVKNPAHVVPMPSKAPVPAKVS